jgi:hypothetical protein
MLKMAMMTSLANVERNVNANNDPLEITREWMMWGLIMRIHN